MQLLAILFMIALPLTAAYMTGYANGYKACIKEYNITPKDFDE